MGILDDNYDIRFKGTTGAPTTVDASPWAFAQQSRLEAERRRKAEEAARKRQEEEARRRRAAERRYSDERTADIRRESAYKLRDEARARKDPYESRYGELPSWEPKTAAELVEFERQMNTQRYEAASQPYSNIDPVIQKRMEYMESGGPGYYEDYWMRSEAGKESRRRWTETERWKGLAEMWSGYQPIVLPPPIDEGYAGYGDSGYSGYSGGYSYPSYSGGSYKQAPRWMQRMVMWSF